MNPDYDSAARKAIETISRFHVNPNFPDPFVVLRKLGNVVMIPYSAEMSDMIPGNNQDAFTLVNKKGVELQYIIIYNQSVQQLQTAMARELAHVILRHDGSSPEYVWSEEASCFAHHFLCPLPLLPPYATRRNINFRPVRDNFAWGMKSLKLFHSIKEMKEYVVEKSNSANRYIGKTSKQNKPDDIELRRLCEYDCRTGWRNCYDVILNGETVGYCGE